MAKFISDTVLDILLDYIKTNGDKLAVCSTQPATYNELISTYMLALHDMTSGDYTLADGDVSGRKLTVAAQSAVTITNSGTAQHLAIGKSSATQDVLLVTTLTPNQALTSGGGNTVDIPTFDYILTDLT